MPTTRSEARWSNSWIARSPASIASSLTTNPTCLRQVLLDLPDIDSHYASHIQITRRMLRHMLFPIWIQSVEKYADQRPQQLLELVAEGNTPGNFIFCLNKIDQVIQHEGEPAAGELAVDYSRRLASLLKLPRPPRVWAISAIHADAHDLPELKELLGQQKPDKALSISRQQAAGWQGRSLLDWIDTQDLEQRLAALDRLQQSADAELAGRVGDRLSQHVIPALLDDPAGRLALADELMQQRVSRWPVVNVLHLVLAPLLSVLRRRMPIEQQRGLEGPDEMVRVHLESLLAGGQPLSAMVQGSFASLQQASPLIGRLYSSRKLWEALLAELAEADLRQRLAATIERQRAALRQRFASSGPIAGACRILLTFGAILWFPFVQPVLEAFLSPNHGELALLVVRVLGVSYLLKNVAFLAIWFAILWLILKWATQRRVDRWMERWKSAEHLDPSLSLTGQTLEWMDELLEPINSARSKLASLIQKRDELRAALRSAEAA